LQIIQVNRRLHTDKEARKVREVVYRPGADQLLFSPCILFPDEMVRLLRVKILAKKNISIGLIVLSALLSISQLFRAVPHDLMTSTAEGAVGSPLIYGDGLMPTVRRGDSRPPRILLGIMGTLWVSYEVKLRVILRRTYLSFDKVHNTTTPHRVCSLDEFASKSSPEAWKPYECQLVYTFVFGGINNTSDREHNTSTFSSLPVVLPESEEVDEFVSRETSHKDYIVLNAKNSNVGEKIWSWYRYVYQSWCDGGRCAFDYVAQADTTVNLHPTEFWQNYFFTSKPFHRVYAGFQVPKSRCSAQKSLQVRWCPSLEATTMTQRFNLLSTDLLLQLMREPTLNPAKVYGSLGEKESVDVGLANLLHNLSPSVASIPLRGVKPVLPSQATNDVAWMEFLKNWDKYKDKIVSLGSQNYSDPVEEARARTSKAKKYFERETNVPGSRILMGIFTMDSDSERERRIAVRETYLSYYKSSDTMPNRICSLQDLIQELLPNDGMDCQMAYTFVMGSNPNGPTNLLQTNSTFPMTVQEVPEALRNETDIIHLNIRENMEDGKSPSWFRYATKVVDEQFYFEYIGKTDTDTLIFPRHFLDITFTKYPSFPKNVRVFGGQERLKYEWGSRMVGPLYMGGQFYWMSIDLARFVTTRDLGSVDVGIEDMSMGNFVHSHPLPIQRIPTVGFKSHRHPLKVVSDFHYQWEKAMRKEKAAN
jgi:hypothetical protein